ncbi:hypothetical protein R3P38DRAFT_3090867 [Favolaschia claudopus]|uniref:Uncharacterized protein n=1 Tax=Favolaschia claudopus TaxID=2862362 RepID=A0AAV9ZTC4_9AGAR
MDQKALVLILSRRCLPCPSRSYLAFAIALSSSYCRTLDFPVPDARPPSSSSPCTTHHRIDPGPEYHNILLLQLRTGLIISLSLGHYSHHLGPTTTTPFFLSIHSHLVSPRYQSTHSENPEITYRYFFSSLYTSFPPMFFSSSFVRTIYRYTPHSLPAQSIHPFCFASSLLYLLFSLQIIIITITIMTSTFFPSAVFFFLYFCSRTTS